MYFYEFLRSTNFLTYMAIEIFKVLGMRCNRLLSAFHSGALMFTCSTIQISAALSGPSLPAAPQLAPLLTGWRLS